MNKKLHGMRSFEIFTDISGYPSKRLVTQLPGKKKRNILEAFPFEKLDGYGDMRLGLKP